MIFNDIDVISDRKVRDEVYKLLNKVLEIGRRFHVSCLCTNHLPTNGKYTRRILNEAHQVVDFPPSASGRLKYLLTDCLGLEEKQVANFRRQNSRWRCIYKNYPQIHMLEHEIGLLNNLDDD